MSHSGSSTHDLGFDLGDDQLAADIVDGMARAEELLVAELSTGEAFVTDKVTHLALAGGKRFRPMFALLASTYGDKPTSDDVVKAAIVVEMTHLATLYHDDVMDEATRRRGAESANHRWNNSVAILAGDYILAIASKLMAQLGTQTVEHFATTFGDLVTGQMRETIGVGPDASLAEHIEHYLTVIREKTAVLIRSAGFLGALHGGARPEHVEALANYGEHLGMVFQIVDDMIDIFSDPSQSGKTPGTDLREGVKTLPILYAMDEDSPAGRELRVLCEGPLTKDEDVLRALELIGQTGARSRTVETLEGHRVAALKELERVPGGPATEALRRLIEFTIARVG